jgi:hypothetical protein
MVFEAKWDKNEHFGRIWCGILEIMRNSIEDFYCLLWVFYGFGENMGREGAFRGVIKYGVLGISICISKK